tara:strand:- start:77 stop:484 length:408 start_codon:yes stop_codon:yes gene_type:complete
MNKKFKIINTETKKLRQFGYIFGIFIPLIFGIILPLIYGHSLRSFPLFIGVPFIFLGLFFPKKLNLIYIIWMKIGFILSWINSRLILFLIFLLVLLPISLISKLFKYDPLKLKINHLISYREIRKESKLDLFRTF